MNKGINLNDIIVPNGESPEVKNLKIKYNAKIRKFNALEKYSQETSKKDKLETMLTIGNQLNILLQEFKKLDFEITRNQILKGFKT